MGQQEDTTKDQLWQGRSAFSLVHRSCQVIYSLLMVAVNTYLVRITVGSSGTDQCPKVRTSALKILSVPTGQWHVSDKAEDGHRQIWTVCICCRCIKNQKNNLIKWVLTIPTYL